MKISVVIPVYNEVESVEQLYKELIKVLSSFDSYQIIFVDDGSSDGSVNVIKKRLIPGYAYPVFHVESNTFFSPDL